MDIFDVLSLICGLALFLYGMDAMGDALKKSAGRKLKTILGNLTSNRFKGLMLGKRISQPDCETDGSSRDESRS